MATLQLEGLRKSFGETAILTGIDLSLADGEMLVIVKGEVDPGQDRLRSHVQAWHHIVPIDSQLRDRIRSRGICLPALAAARQCRAMRGECRM